MVLASLLGRNGRTTNSARVARAKSSRWRKDDEHPGGDEAAAAQPNIDELRRKRAEYYTNPADERRRVSSIFGAKPSTKSTASSNASMPRAVPVQRRKRRNPTRTTAKASKQARVVAESVYPPAQYAATARSDVGQGISDEEVTPEDSISQVGLNPPAPPAGPSAVPSSLARGSTGSAKLKAIAEDSENPSSLARPTQRRERRQSSILGGLLQRNSTKPPPRPSPRLVECLTCGSDDVPSTKTAKLSCGHRMCHDCLKRVFEMSVKDPQHMPPRCCTKDHIPLKHVDKLFDLKFKVLWNKKYQEYHTRNRVYCPAPKCGEWIKPSHFHVAKGRKYGLCPRCNTKVCTSCSAKMHKSADCPKDPEIAELVKQGKEEGWQSCYNCHAMIELKEGCNHMTCRCTAEFCMVCGSKWKTCECPWFNARDLPDADRLNDMRVPEEIQVIYRRVMNAAGIPIAADPHPPEGGYVAEYRRQRTYNEELEHRQRQERLDADLARRMQLGLLLDVEVGVGDEEVPRDRHRAAHQAAWGLTDHDNGHFMNDNYVANAANVVMSTFGDAAMGRRGDRESGRRRRARQSARQDADHAGLIPNFLGDESVLGVGPSRRVR
ncbi:putative E3 ubiquitin-protein ligase ARI3 [Cercospora zeina]